MSPNNVVNIDGSISIRKIVVNKEEIRKTILKISWHPDTSRLVLIVATKYTHIF